jgi:hypothetical protein
VAQLADHPCLVEQLAVLLRTLRDHRAATVLRSPAAPRRPFSLRSICRVRTPADSMLRLACSSFRRVASRTSPNLPNSVLMAPRTAQTSDDRRSMANVRKPICRLLSSAASVVGPAMQIRRSRCRRQPVQVGARPRRTGPRSADRGSRNPSCTAVRRTCRESFSPRRAAALPAP